MELRNKVCLISGASGAIGSSVAKHFYREGAHLALTYRTTGPGPVGLREEMVGLGRVELYKLDVADWEQVQVTIREVENAFSGIDVLVNCTGIVGPIGAFETLDIRAWVQTIETNLIGTVHLARAVLPTMKERGHGKIILFSGGGAAYARPYFTPYSSSKAALVRFAESLAQELESANIQVNAIAPGPVNSRMWSEMRAASASGGPALLQELKRMEETGGTSPERAAGLAAFLASDRSNGLSGRLLSAVWDDWEHLEGHIEKIASSDVWTLRRVPLN
jgi:NAD(P)-dependent dehydrogenase (short-subunit alcohol dehydrogenase family)